jgi:hypothetical protein
VFSEKRANAKGEEVAVQTLFVGLGAALLANDTADLAGVDAPVGASGDTKTDPGIRFS